MISGFLIRLRAGERLYLAPRDHVAGLLITDAAHQYQDDRGRPLVLRDLGPLLDRCSTPSPGRRHTLTVVLRRRSIGLRVDRADDLAHGHALETTALPPLIARRQANPWCIGVAAIEDQPVLVLDLRRIAADVALGAV
ncbi:MAG: hypothetical protein HC822_11995 [Oscillochloris sp.]|nr:hypothetical protein [Oscillochloris sp.]